MKLVVRVSPPAVAVTVIVDVPAGVEPLVLMLRVVEHTGLHEAEENETVAPGGKPEALKETAWVVPDANDAAIELLPEEPAATTILPEFDRAKSNGGWVMINDALASALGL